MKTHRPIKSRKEIEEELYELVGDVLSSEMYEELKLYLHSQRTDLIMGIREMVERIVGSNFNLSDMTFEKDEKSDIISKEEVLSRLDTLMKEV